MLKIQDLTFSIAGQNLFTQANAIIPTGHKVGIVGQNGTGKTTLFRLLQGEYAPDGGEISLPASARMGGISQEVPSSPLSLLETVLQADTERHSLLEESQTATDPQRIAEIQTRLTDIDAWSGEARASSILAGLGFPSSDQLRPCSDFSGGWRMRVALAGVLFACPDFLLLDEPTNYLDLEGALWLENYLASYPHTVLIISHDRALLNRAISSILHLSERKLTLWNVPYDIFARQRAEKAAQLASTARKQAEHRAHMQSYVDRFRYKASKAKQAQSRLKMIEKMEPITLPEEARNYVFTFPQPEQMSPPILCLEDAAVGYGEKPILQQLTLRIDQDDRIALLGKNGEGKSTLSKLLAQKLSPMSGKRIASSRLRIGYFAQHQLDELEPKETPLTHLARALPQMLPVKHRAKLASFGLGPAQVEMRVENLSGGQKARLSLLLATLESPHLLILDEPTNHLDIQSREALIEALSAYKGAVILVSHDMHLLSLVADRLWLVENGKVLPYHEDLESYRQHLLKKNQPEKKSVLQEKPPTSQNAPRDVILRLKAEERKCEARVDTLLDMRKKLDAKLADPDFYTNSTAQDIAKWQKKHAELQDALDRAENLWMDVLERLRQG